MVTKVTKFKSQNLLGETRTEEKKRLRKIVVKGILKGKKPSEVLKQSSLKGATKGQLAKRKKILKKAGLSGQKAPTIKERRAFL